MSGNFPLLDLRGSPREQGETQGRLLRREILQNIEVYYRRFQEEVGLTPEEVARRTRAYEPVLQTESPSYWEGLLGIARGSGIEIGDVAMLNVRYELLYDRHSKTTVGGGCTGFALAASRTEERRLILAQNWDWIPEVRCALLRSVDERGFTILSFTEAGIFGGKIGFNSQGLGLAINGLNSTEDEWSRLQKPFHVRCHEILRSASVEEARRVVTDGERTCSANFLLAQAGEEPAPAASAPSRADRGAERLLDLESAPRCVGRHEATDGRIVHTNHFVDPRALGVTEPEADLHPCTHSRKERMERLLGSERAFSREDLRSFLRDHEGTPGSICRHPDPASPSWDRYATVASIVMDLTEREMEICPGLPCQGDYARISLSNRP